MSTTDARPPIPDPMKREVRQRCGFGCVLCGRPFIHYDHMTDYSVSQEHSAAGITLLCGYHHDLKTKGILPEHEVRAANRAPLNHQVGTTHPVDDLRLKGSVGFDVLIGSNAFGVATNGTPRCALMIDGLPMFVARVEDQTLLLSLLIFDSCNQLVLQMADNELVMNPNAWDIEHEGARLTIREGTGRILFEINFTPPGAVDGRGTVEITRGRFLRNGVEVHVTRQHIALLNQNLMYSRRSYVEVDGVFVAIGLPQPNSAFLRLPFVDRYTWDREGALQWAKAQGMTDDELAP